MAALIFSTNCFADTYSPARMRAVTPSPFHCSMTLASWVWAAEVSEPTIVTTAGEP